ncbi:phospholipid carrier-dependent glycosyltransferase [candidate division WWE3 bacterium]|nr:phospholipid carrier-dependent glycosyltransferase [candidate division WWE3 bacterium]
MKKLKPHKAVILLFIVAFLIRFIGIEHGFPFIFHIDEPAVVRSALGIRFDANPGHFDWPHLHFYLTYFLFFVFIKARSIVQFLGLQSFLAFKMPILWQDPLVFYLLARTLDVFMGALTVIPVYLAGRELFGNRGGFLAALTFAFMPFHVHASHFALVDVPATFWIAWALYFSTKIYNQKPKESTNLIQINKFNSTLKDNLAYFKYYILAGFFIGLAASTKYHGGIAAVVVAVAHFARVYKNSKEKFVSWAGLKNLIISGLSAVGGFILGTPFAILDFSTFIRTDSPTGALWQFTNVGSVTLLERLNQFFQAITYRFALDIGPTFIAVYLIYIFYSLFIRRDRRSLIILIPSLLLFFYVSGFEKMRVHYYMPTYPFIALAVGAMSSHIIAITRNHIQKRLVYWAVFLIPILLAVNTSIVLLRSDTRLELFDWLNKNMTITDYVVYNSSSVSLITDKISKDRSFKGVKDTSLVNKVGYIVIYKDTDELVHFLAGNDSDSKIAKKYPLVKRISATGRRGGEIFIYSLGK